LIKKSITVLKITITAIIIIYLINVTDFNLLKDIILNSNKTLLFSSFLILLLITVFQAYRFSFVSSNFEININLYKSWKNIAIGILYNQVLPSTIGGDGIRFLNLKELKYNTKNSLKSIIIDRVYGLLGLCLICLVGSLAIISFNFNSRFLIVTQLISFTSIAFFLFSPFVFKKYSSNFLKKIKVLELLNNLYFFNNNKTISKVLLLSIFIHFLLSIVGFLILGALNISVDLWPFLWLFLSSLLISTIPVSIGGWGFREGIFIISMRLIGIDTETSIAISFIYAFETSIIGLIGGVLWSSRFLKKN
jgi:glycosyltransferase 2 family protein